MNPTKIWSNANEGSCACEMDRIHEERYSRTYKSHRMNETTHVFLPDDKSSRWSSEHLQFTEQRTGEVDPNLTKSAPRAQIAFSDKEPKPDTRQEKRFVHLIAGGASGCASTLVTCPIDVIKTRQQSSTRLATSTTTSKLSLASRAPRTVLPNFVALLSKNSFRRTLHSGFVLAPGLTHSSILHHCRYIWKVEGPRSFYKGLGPSLVGVVPSRAIHFYTYDAAKKVLQRNTGLRADSSMNHVVAALCGGLMSTTATCPLWVLKTRQQLHRRTNNTALSAFECCRRIWKTEGARGFYRGLSASYAGIFETVLYFAIYERIKAYYLRETRLESSSSALTMCSFRELPALMIISSASKVAATTMAYPHEVARTRLREEAVQKKYRGFWQTLHQVQAKEGVRALYAGLPAQLVRQVPNMAIVMGVYEAVVYLAT